MTSAKRIDCWLLAVILAGALAIRLWHLAAGVPYAVEVDEPVVIDRALHILSTGSWYPLGFDYPSLVVYFHACLAALRYLWGATQGQWKSLATFDIGAVYTTARFATALIGTATVWLTYRLGVNLESRTLGLVAAAQLAVYPMHVRESHFALTDAATALVLLTLWLTVRASRSHTVAAYAWAGCAAGLSAAANYNGGVVAVMIAFTWLVHEYRAPDRRQKAWAALAAMIGAFLVTVPYTSPCSPRVSQRPRRPTGAVFFAERYRERPVANVPDVPLARMAVLGACRAPRRCDRLVAPAFAQTMAGAHRVCLRLLLRAVHAHRGLWPVCLADSAGGLSLGSCSRRRARRFASERYQSATLSPVVLVLGTMLMTAWFAADSIKWLNDFARPDTRVLAARWMLAAFPKATPMVVENSGPTNLAHAASTCSMSPMP